MFHLSLSLSLAPALVTLSQDPRSHNPARDFGDSLRVMTFMTGVRNIIIIRPGDILEVRVIRGSELTNERLHQRRLMSRLTLCSMSVSRLNTLSPSPSGSVPLNILGASLIYYLPFTGSCITTSQAS